MTPPRSGRRTLDEPLRGKGSANDNRRSRFKASGQLPTHSDVSRISGRPRRRERNVPARLRRNLHETPPVRSQQSVMWPPSAPMLTMIVGGPFSMSVTGIGTPPWIVTCFFPCHLPSRCRTQRVCLRFSSSRIDPSPVAYATYLPIRRDGRFQHFAISD